MLPEHSQSMNLADIQSLEADILLNTDGYMHGRAPEIVGHVRAQFAEGVFSYRVDWTGPDAWIQELGWKFTMPNACDHFSWQRKGRWSYYPPTNIGRSTGTATPDSADAHITRIDRPDAFDFNSSKYDCEWASLTDAAGRGLCVQFLPETPPPTTTPTTQPANTVMPNYAVRGGFGDNGTYVLVVNKQASPPHENDWISDYFFQFKKGDHVESSMIVGSVK